MPESPRRGKRRGASSSPLSSSRASRAAARVASAAGAAIGEARTIVYVHGIGNKPVPSVLKCQWDRALFGFDLGERSRLAYWVNRDYYPQAEAGTCGSGDRVDIESAPTGRGVSVRQHLGELSIDDEAAAVTDDPRAHATLVAIAETVERDAEARARRHEAAGASARVVQHRSLAGLLDREGARLVAGAVHLAAEVLRRLEALAVPDARTIDVVPAAPARPVADEVEAVAVAWRRCPRWRRWALHAMFSRSRRSMR